MTALPESEAATSLRLDAPCRRRGGGWRRRPRAPSMMAPSTMLSGGTGSLPKPTTLKPLPDGLQLDRLDGARPDVEADDGLGSAKHAMSSSASPWSGCGPAHLTERWGVSISARACAGPQAGSPNALRVPGCRPDHSASRVPTAEPPEMPDLPTIPGETAICARRLAVPHSFRRPITEPSRRAESRPVGTVLSDSCTIDSLGTGWVPTTQSCWRCRCWRLSLSGSGRAGLPDWAS